MIAQQWRGDTNISSTEGQERDEQSDLRALYDRQARRPHLQTHDQGSAVWRKKLALRGFTVTRSAPGL